MTVEETLTALQEILDGAAERDLTDEEIQRYEELEKTLNAAQRSEEIRKRNAAYNTVKTPALVTAKKKGEDELERAFDAYLRTGKENADIVQLRAQGEGVGTEGGYLVPEGFRNRLVERLKAFGGIANVVETITTSTGNDLPWPTVDDTSNVGEIVAEGGTFSSGADMVFGVKSLGAYKYMAGGGSSLPLRVSVELLQDAAFDVSGLVSRKLGERIARIQSTHLITGSGAGQPEGIVTGLTGVQSGQNTGLKYDDLVTYIHSVDPAYRDGARWAFNDATLAIIKKLKDAAGDPLWRPDSADIATGTGGGTLVGYPVTVDQGFATYVANSPTVNYGVFGRLDEGYVIRRVRDIQLIVNPWTRAANGQVEYTAWARMDAAQQNTNAYVALTGKA